jgi:hypothetical protein
MRTFIACSIALVAIAACGGSQKKTDTDVNSLSDPGGGGGGGGESSSSSESSTSTSGGGGGSPSSGTSSSHSSSSSTSSAASAASSAAAPTVFHPKPSTNGEIDGKSFAPRMAMVLAPMQKDGRIVIVLAEADDCVKPGDAQPGDGSISLLLPWKDGWKQDLASMVAPKGKSNGDISFSRLNDGKKSQLSTTFTPIGTVTIVKAPMDQNSFGKMKIDLTSGGYMLAGDIDVKVCVSPK